MRGRSHDPILSAFPPTDRYVVDGATLQGLEQKGVLASLLIGSREWGGEGFLSFVPGELPH